MPREGRKRAFLGYHMHRRGAGLGLAGAIAAALLAGWLSGCKAIYDPEDRALRKHYATNAYPVNTLPKLRTVGLVVLDASTGDVAPDMPALANALYTQLQSVEGLEVLPNSMTLSVAEEKKLVLPRDGLKLAEALNADGVFVGIVTEYQPYGEPVIGIGLALFSRAAAPGLSRDMDQVIQGGKPLAMPEMEARPVTAVYGVFDASQATTRKRIEYYAAGQTASQVGLGWERYYRVMPNFMRFVSYEMAWQIFDQLQVNRSVDMTERR